MNKSSKGLTIGIVALIVIGAGVFFLSNSAATPVGQSQKVAQATPTPATANATDAAEGTSKTLPATPAPLAPPPADAAKTPASNSSLLAAPAALSIDVAAAMKDRVLGKPDAPVTIIEYASMTCPHCAHFSAEILPEFKKRLIDTGKAKLIFRDYPLDNFALRAAMMARCVPADKYFSLNEVIFSNQERWARAKDPLESLSQLGGLAGMDPALFQACTQNTELETAILNGVQDAQTKYHVESTPTFIFNDGAETISGAQDVSKFEDVVNKLTKGK